MSSKPDATDRAPYNKAFFSLYEDTFLILKAKLGLAETLATVADIFQTNLGRGFDQMEFRKGRTEDFVRVISARDASVGLDVRFPEVSERGLVYQFFTDPFPNLKGAVEHAALDATYMNFKVQRLLGEGWSYRTTKHLWDGDPCTEHVIQRA